MVTSGPKDKKKLSKEKKIKAEIIKLLDSKKSSKINKIIDELFKKPFITPLKKALITPSKELVAKLTKKSKSLGNGKTKSDKDMALSGGIASGKGGRTKSDKDIKRVKGKPHLKHGGKAKKRK